MIDAYTADEPTHGGHGMPRGPLGTHEAGQVQAIGFCPLCGTNARRTCSNRGVFDCPTCFFVWYDERVGEQWRSFEDYFSPAGTEHSTDADRPDEPGE